MTPCRRRLAEEIEMPIELPACPFMGPPHPAEPPRPLRELPSDFETNPFKYLPPRYVLSADELDLAARYEQGDFSRGYLASQTAYFRREKTPEEHARRRNRFAPIQAQAERLGLAFPPALLELVETDEYNNRLRHNTMFLSFGTEIAPLPAYPNHFLLLVFAEEQGCGNWHLLFKPDGSHAMALSEHGFGDYDAYPGGKQPDPTRYEVYQCADSFNAWLVNFFLSV
jgi:hypothetical protein